MMKSRHSKSGAGRPPALAGLLVGLLAPRDLRDAILGDLLERYKLLLRGAGGSRRARRWYWRQAVAALNPTFGFRLREPGPRRDHATRGTRGTIVEQV